MSKIIALFAVLAILTGVIVLAVPREAPPAPAATRSAGPPPELSMIAKVRDIAEQANAPLSIIFGLISLYYSRRTYLAQGKR